LRHLISPAALLAIADVSIATLKKYLDPHMLRQTAATLLIESDVDIISLIATANADAIS
jgi:hypothetical protein